MDNIDKNINSTKWINKWLNKGGTTHYIDIADHEIYYVRDFVFIWNIFESSISEGKQGNIIEIANTMISDKQIIDSQIHKFFQFAVERYVSNGKCNDYFHRLRLPESLQESVVISNFVPQISEK